MSWLHSMNDDSGGLAVGLQGFFTLARQRVLQLDPALPCLGAPHSRFTTAETWTCDLDLPGLFREQRHDQNLTF